MKHLAKWLFLSLGGAWLAASCSSDRAGEYCAAYGPACGRTCSDGDPCPLGLHCTDGSCAADCTPAGGCESGQVCTLQGTCGAPSGGVDGTPCSEAAECPDGFFCSARACRPFCGPDRPCPSGMTCASSGFCVSGPTFGSGGGFGNDGGGGYYSGDGCVNLNVGFEGQTPTVLLLVDQSKSMDQHFPEGAATTRWSLLHDALMDPNTGVVKQTEGVVRFGLTLYTSHGGNRGGMCPILTTVPIALNSYANIKTRYDAAMPDSDTPTGPSIDAAVQELQAFNEVGPKYILLVSDGLPDTCENSNPGRTGQEAANQLTVKAAQRAYEQHIGLFEMGVSADIALDHLQQMANAGAGKDPATMPPNAAPFWVAQSSQADLAAQLTSIIGSVRTCVFRLQGMVTDGAAPSGIVRLDGQGLAYNDPNGWRLNGPSELEVLGAACEKIKTSSRDISISFPCDSFTPVN